MAYRDVRIKEAGNRLAFRYDPEADRIEVMIRGERFEVLLDDYRPLQRRRCEMAGVDFGHIDGDSTGVL